MTRILVLGATGYLGSQIAQTLRRTGQHTVYGVTRSSNSAAKLARDELTPLVIKDPINEENTLIDSITTNRIDLVIDVTSSYGGAAKLLSSIVNAGQQRVKSYEAHGIQPSPKLGYIYISGAWVHGETATEASDLDLVGLPSSEAPPLDMVSWRPELERKILASRDVLDVMILRPATMYGRGSSIWGAFFGPIASAVAEKKSSVKIPVSSTARSSLVHVDDVAEAVSLAATQLPVVSGTGVFPVFNLSSSVENISDVLQAFANALRAKASSDHPVQLDLVGPGDDAFLKALGSSVHVSRGRAHHLLNWSPRRLGFAREMTIFASAWEAAL